MKAQVLVDTLWHLGRRPAVGEVIEMSDAAALAGEESGLVRILAEETGEAEETTKPAKKGK